MIIKIAEGIYTGAFQDINNSHKHGLSISNVVDVRHIVDKVGNDIAYIIKAINLAKQTLQDQGRVLITCDMGVSRSRVIAIGLLSELGNDVDESISLVLSSANNPEINPDLLFQVRRFYKSKNYEGAKQQCPAATGVIVLGSNGFVGSALMRCLLKKQIDSIALSRVNVDIKEEHVRLITTLDSLNHTTVVFCAHPTLHHTAKSLSDSILLLKNTLEACRLTGKSLIYISSMVVYLGNAHSSDNYIYKADENIPALPFGSYSESKYLCEQLIDAYRINYGLKVIVVRPCGLYGSAMREQWLIPKLIKKALNNEEIVTHKYNNGLPSFELLHVDDFADAIAMLLKDKKCPETINIGSHKLISTFELAALIKSITQSSSHVSLLHISDRTRNLLSIPGYIDRLGWEPKILLKDGLNMCISNFAERCL